MMQVGAATHEAAKHPRRARFANGLCERGSEGRHRQVREDRVDVIRLALEGRGLRAASFRHFGEEWTNPQTIRIALFASIN
jgi:hypothetical protein